ncbi:hypothetical protein TWF694_003752 [Orbilia ellipsospora]|uniref:Amidase domain-containing protein n=1 Tax=Orbilia ellipsospora TaxID=2528407 RepID=A0AAV9WZ65_9PEZI
MQLPIITGPAFSQSSATIELANPYRSESIVFNIGGVSYLLSPEPEDVKFRTGATGIEPLTVFHVDGRVVTTEWLYQTIDRYLESDDVFSAFFLRSAVFQTAAGSIWIESGAMDLLWSWGNRILHIRVSVTPEEMLLPGPYFSTFSGFHQAFRLYEDTASAFMISTVPSQKGDFFKTVQAAASGNQNMVVAVPSRLRFTKSDTKPLAGVRVAVQDLLHLNGVSTSGGSRAYQQLYPKQVVTSPVIQRLIDKGAVIVGKTKTAEFGGQQEVLGDWTDILCPFNPRGDGDLNPSSGSTGSAAAIAAYPWLDLALGMDGGGGVRDPSRAQGIYGLRPTHDGHREVGSIAPAPAFHRSGIIGRNISELLLSAKQWLGGEKKPWRDEFRLPKKLLIIRDYATENPEVQQIFDDFVGMIEGFLKINRTIVDIAELWESKKPEDTSLSFFEYFHETFMSVMGADFYSEFAAFREEYASTYGRRPYASPPTRRLWDLAAKEPPEKRAVALTKIKFHNEWFCKHVLEDDPMGSSDTVIIVPHPPPQFRDEYRSAPSEKDYDGFNSNYHASFSGVPELVVPIGQISYLSPISGQNEYMPIVASIIGPKNSDFMLLNLVAKVLARNNLPESVLTGRAAFPTE